MKGGKFKNKEQRLVFEYISRSLEKAHIPVVICSDNELQSKMDEHGKIEFLRLPNKGREFEIAAKNAINLKGIVASNLNERVVDVVSMERHPYEGSGKEAIEAAKKWGLTNLVGHHTAHEGAVDEFEYYIDKDFFGEALSEKAKKKSTNLGMQIALLKYIPELIEKSVDAEIHPDYEKVNGNRTSDVISSIDMLVHRLYGAIYFEGEIFCVKTTMYEYRDPRNKTYTYEIKNIRPSQGGPILGVSGIPSVDDAPVDGLKISCANLLNGIEKSYDPGKKLLEESALVKSRMTDIFVNVGRRVKDNFKGRIYGWAENGTIYLTKAGINPYTPIHEYTHLWAKAMRQNNPQGWSSVVGKLKSTPIWEEVIRDPNYSTLADDNETASEALARISGYCNTQKLESIAHRSLLGDDMDTLVGNFQAAIQDFWGWTSKTLFDIKDFSSTEEICDRVILDLTDGTHLNIANDSAAEFDIGEYTCKINICQARFPDTGMKIWSNLPYSIKSLSRNDEHIDSITIQNGNGDSEKFAGEMIDKENRIVLELKDMTIKYGIETGKAEFFPPLKEDKSEARQNDRPTHRTAHKGR